MPSDLAHLSYMSHLNVNKFATPDELAPSEHVAEFLQPADLLRLARFHGCTEFSIISAESDIPLDTEKLCQFPRCLPLALYRPKFTFGPYKYEILLGTERRDDSDIDVLMKILEKVGCAKKNIDQHLKPLLTWKGYDFDAQGIRVSQDVCDTIKGYNFDNPVEPSYLTAFTDMAACLFVPSFPRCYPLIGYLRKPLQSYPCRLKDKHRKVIQKLKQMFASPPKLRFFNPVAKVTVIRTRCESPYMEATLYQDNMSVVTMSRDFGPKGHANENQSEKALLAAFLTVHSLEPLCRWLRDGPIYTVISDYRAVKFPPKDLGLGISATNLMVRNDMFAEYGCKLLYKPEDWEPHFTDPVEPPKCMLESVDAEWAANLQLLDSLDILPEPKTASKKSNKRKRKKEWPAVNEPERSAVNELEMRKPPIEPRQIESRQNSTQTVTVVDEELRRYRLRTFRAERGYLEVCFERYMHSLDDRLKSFEQETLQKMQIYNLIPGKVDKLKEEFEAQTKLLQHNKTIATALMKMNMAALEAGVPLDDLPIIDAQYGDLKKLEVTVSQLVKRHRDDNPQFDSLHSSSESSVESDSIAALPSQPGAASAQSQIKRHLVQHQPASNQPAPVAAKSAVDDLTTFVLDDDDFDGTMATIPKEAVQSPRISSASVPAPLSQSQRSHPNQLGVPPITHQQGNRPTNVVSQQTTAVYPNKTVCDINMSTTPTAPAEKPAPLTELQPTPPVSMRAEANPRVSSERQTGINWRQSPWDCIVHQLMGEKSIKQRRAETLLENAAISVGGTAADLDVIYQKALSILADKSAPPPQALPSEAPPIQAPPGQAPPRQAPPSEALPSQAPPSQAPPSQILSNGAAIRTASPAARTASPAVRTTAQKSTSKEGDITSHVPNSFYKVTMCRNVEAGRWCPFADSCIFAHSQAELRRPQDRLTKPSAEQSPGWHEEPCQNQQCPARLNLLLQKTGLCKMNEIGRCQFGSGCKFAHGRRELKPMPKWEMCRRNEEGRCHADPSKCVYAHSRSELRPIPQQYRKPNHMATPILKPVAARPVFTSVHEAPPVNSDDACLFCLLHVDKKQKLPCGHNQWHFKCISRWLNESKPDCPICRQPAELPDTFIAPQGLKPTDFPSLGL